MYRKSVIAPISGRIRPPTAQCGSTKASCRLGTAIVIVSVLASVRAAALVALLLAVPPALELLAPAGRVVPAAVAAAILAGLDPLLSPPQAASTAARPAPAPPSSTERRV